MSDYRTRATREEAQMVIVRAFAEIYSKFNELNRITRNLSTEASMVKNIYIMLSESFAIDGSRTSRDIGRRIYDNIYDELSAVSDEEINNLLNMCYELAKKYNLIIEQELYNILNDNDDNQEFMINARIRSLIMDIAKKIADKELGIVSYVLSKWLDSIGLSDAGKLFYGINVAFSIFEVSYSINNVLNVWNNTRSTKDERTLAIYDLITACIGAIPKVGPVASFYLTQIKKLTICLSSIVEEVNEVINTYIDEMEEWIDDDYLGPQPQYPFW